jgi:hypothetical protein
LFLCPEDGYAKFLSSNDNHLPDNSTGDNDIKTCTVLISFYVSLHHFSQTRHCILQQITIIVEHWRNGKTAGEKEIARSITFLNVNSSTMNNAQTVLD